MQLKKDNNQDQKANVIRMESQKKAQLKANSQPDRQIKAFRANGNRQGKLKLIEKR